ncbi:MAG: hypothetical protein ABWY37_06925 [Microbacterium pygmaeum]
MGQLIYGMVPAIEVDDWGLAHLQAVMLTKLRRDESFGFSWEARTDLPADAAPARRGQRGTIWISRGSSLYFSYDGPRGGPLNARWLTALAESASSSNTFRLVAEPE